MVFWWSQMSESNPPTIALLGTWLDGWYQSQLWRGAVAGTRLHGGRLLTVVGYARPESAAPSTRDGVYGLAARGDVQATLLSVGPLCFWEGAAAVVNLRSWLPAHPVVALGQEFPGTDSVLPDGGGIDEVARHLVVVHGKTRIAYLGGPATNVDSARRRGDFERAMASLDVPILPEGFEPGDFTFEGGERAMEILLGRIGVPEAVVAANDAMAMGAIKTLRKRGLDIPQDVLVTGYDDSEEGRSHSPSLTTVRSPTHFVAVRGVELALERLRDPSRPLTSERLGTSPVVRKSCGCLVTTSVMSLPGAFQGKPSVKSVGDILCDPAKGVRDAFLRRLQRILQDAEDGEQEEWSELIVMAARRINAVSDPLDRAAAQETLLQAQSLLVEARQGLQGARRRETNLMVRELHRATNLLLDAADPGGYLDLLASVVPSWCPEGMRIFLYHGSFEPQDDVDLSRCSFEVRLDLLDGRCSPIPESEDLLPAVVVPGEVWTAVPLEQGSHRFGVAIFRNWTRNEAFVEHLRLSLSLSIHQVWKRGVESRLRGLLEEQSIRDELTGLFNRRGLKEVGIGFARQSEREGRRLLVLMADIDGLKPVNDTWGHGDGDIAIRTMAEALVDCFRRSDVVARVGGDEFAVLCHVSPDSRPEELVERLRGLLAKRCETNGRPWTVGASVGWADWNPAEDPEMREAMAQADLRLYRDKVYRKGL